MRATVNKESDCFIEAYRSPDGATFMEHRDGVPWYEAPKRPWRCRLRRHLAQTRGWMRAGYMDPSRPQTRSQYVERCSCGAVRFGTSGGWDKD